MLEVRGLNIQYGTKTVIECENLNFEKGKVYTIIGASGSGKSSILNVIGLLQSNSTSTSIKYENFELLSLSEKDKSVFRAKYFSYILQQESIFPDLTVFENVALPLEMYSNNEAVINQTVENALTFLDIEYIANKLPVRLSGGEIQRVAIARACAQNTDVIFADEPTASLDDGNKKNVIEAFVKIARELNKIVIIVTHDKEVSKAADVILEVKDERIIKTLSTHHENQSLLSLDFMNQDLTLAKSEIISKRFFKNYSKKTTSISIIIILLLAFSASLLMLSINFGNNFISQQENVLNKQYSRNIFANSNTMKIGKRNFHYENMPISESDVLNIKSNINVGNIYPYFEFSSSAGYIVNNNQSEMPSASIMYNNKKSEYSQKTSKNLVVSPYYENEIIESLLIEKSKTKDNEDNVYITEQVANDIFGAQVIPDSSDIIIIIPVPVQLYTSTVTFNDGRLQTSVMPEVELHTLNVHVAGIIKDEAMNIRNTSDNKSGIIIPYHLLQTTLDKSLSKNKRFERFDSNLKAIDYEYSSYMIFVKTPDMVSKVADSYKNTITGVEFSSPAQSLVEQQQSLSSIKSMTWLITILLCCLTGIIFGITYYFKSKTRRREVGLLKLLGFRNNDVLKLFTFELFKSIVSIYFFSIVVSFLLMVVGNSWFGAVVFSITPLSLFACLFVITIIVYSASLLSIYKVATIDPVKVLQDNR